MNSKIIEQGASAARGDDGVAEEAFFGFGGDEAPSKRVGTVEGGRNKTKDQFDEKKRYCNTSEIFLACLLSGSRFRGFSFQGNTYCSCEEHVSCLLYDSATYSHISERRNGEQDSTGAGRVCSMTR